jgi:ABC-type multidrug transport system permease subunit
MRLILLCARKDLRRMLRDPIGLVTWIGIPLLIGLVMVALFGRGEPKPQGLLLIADQDDTFVSSFLARAYTQGKLGEMITVNNVKLAEGRKRIGAGDGSALLIIPKGFTNALLRNEPIKLELVTNPSQAILPEMLREVTEILIDGAWYLHQFIGDDLHRFADMQGSPPDALIGEFSIKIRRLFDSVGRYVNPPAIEVASEVVEQNPGSQVNVAQLMFPSMIYMSALFLAFGYSGDIWKERMQGTLRRFAMSPGSPRHFLAGKLVAVGVVYAVLAAVALLTASLLLGMPVRNVGLVVLWIPATGGGIYLMMVVLSTLASTPRAASVLTNFAVMTLAMMGGAFFPFEVMPGFLSRIGKLTPNGWALLRLKEMLGGQAGAASIAVAFAATAVVGTLLFVLASRRLRRGFFV